MALKKFRAFGREYAIPLQVLALVLALIEVFMRVPLYVYVLNKQDDLSQLAGLGPLSVWPWFLLFGGLFSSFGLWVILRLLDADLNERSE